MTTIKDFMASLSKLRAIDREKDITIEGQPIQSIVIKEYKSEKVFTVKDNDGNLVYMTDDNGDDVLDEKGFQKVKQEIEVTLSYKAHFTTGKANEDYKTVNKLLSALDTLSAVEKAGGVVYGDDDIFIVGDDYTYADRINVDTDCSLNDILNNY